MMPDTRLKFCPTCQKEKRTSTVREVEVCAVNLVYYIVDRFWDSEGRYHVHNPETHSFPYECSNGHTWAEDYPCPSCWCGWPNGPRTESET